MVKIKTSIDMYRTLVFVRIILISFVVAAGFRSFGEEEKPQNNDVGISPEKPAKREIKKEEMDEAYARWSKKKLAEEKAKENIPLAQAIVRGDLKTVKAMVDAGVELDSEIYAGDTPLLLATCYGHVDMVRMLIDAGADVDFPGSVGGSALSVAAYNGNMDICRLLLERGADVNLRSGMDEAPPMICASREGHVEIARLLLASGADVNATNQWGETALHLSSFNGRPDVVQLLVHQGADLNAKADRDKMCPTALHLAVYWDRPEIVKILVDAGSDIHRRNDHGQSPYILSLRCENMPISKVFIRKLIKQGYYPFELSAELSSLLESDGAEFIELAIEYEKTKWAAGAEDNDNGN